MMKEFFPQEPIDPRLINLLNSLKDTPPRDPDLAEQNKSKYLSELENMPIPTRRPSAFRQFLVGLGISADTNKYKENNKMTTNNKRLAVKVIAVLVVLVIVLFGGTTATVLASQNSIPGDTLYPIKTTLERTRLSLARSADARVELQLEFAEQRLAEIESLIKEGRFQNIKPAATAFEGHIFKALEELSALAEANPDQAGRLMVRLTESISRYAAALSEMAGRVPEPVRADLQNTIINLGGGDNANDRFNENDNFNDNDNFNENGNYNDSYNDNDNYNDSYNDNENDSYNDNDNYNDSYNDNENDSYDDNDNYNQNTSDNCTFGSVSVDELNVPQNTTCTLSGTRVEGNIFVHGNATLLAYDVWVDGNIQADRSARVEVHAGSYVGGNIQVDYGGLLLVSSVQIGGNLQAFNNWGNQSYTGNMIGGDLQAFENSGGVSIWNNTIEGNLQCKKNSPAPTGGGNSVYGNKEDQCFGL
jgi:hypothetical protein